MDRLEIPVGFGTHRCRISLLRIERIANSLRAAGAPLLDIKPYVASFEETADLRTGWLDQHKDQIRRQTSDNRFTK